MQGIRICETIPSYKLFMYKVPLEIYLLIMKFYLEDLRKDLQIKLIIGGITYLDLKGGLFRYVVDQQKQEMLNETITCLNFTKSFFPQGLLLDLNKYHDVEVHINAKHDIFLQCVGVNRNDGCPIVPNKNGLVVVPFLQPFLQPWNSQLFPYHALNPRRSTKDRQVYSYYTFDENEVDFKKYKMLFSHYVFPAYKGIMIMENGICYAHGMAFPLGSH
jgi:hypothetical protein